MRFRTFAFVGVAGLLSAFGGTALSAQSTGLEDLVGARAGQAEGELARRGYKLIRTQTGDDRKYTYWWSHDRRQCVTIATMDGRYDSITATPAPDCGKSAGERPTTLPERPGSPNRPVESGRPGYRPDYQPGYHPPMPPPPQVGRPSYVPSYPGGGVEVDGQRVDIGLVCFGDGQKPATATSYGWTWNSRRDRYDYGSQTSLTTQQFDASLMLQFFGPDAGRIRLPRGLIPPINSRGDSGWWDLYDVNVGPDIITAKYRLNGLNKPRLTVDRRSGRITVQGTGSYAFRGTCDRVGSGDRRF